MKATNIENAKEFITKFVADKQGNKPTFDIDKVGSKKVLTITFWNGLSTKMRNRLTIDMLHNNGNYGVAQFINYPCIFNNHKGGGIVESYTMIWLK